MAHLRPITLLNTDGKIIEKILANRIEPALNYIISEDQRGFQKNKRICSNIRMIFELITYSDKKDMETLLLSLDFMKCFDRIEFEALFGALKFFDFPEKIVDWTKILVHRILGNNSK